MGVVRYCSDPHFGHRNMAIKRGFKDEHEHDEYIIQQWNKVVSKKDTVWILGDITMEKSNYEILNKLNGVKKVILGNHDQPQHVPKLLQFVNKVCGILYYKHKTLGNFILTHAPIHPCELEYRFDVNIHGHVHENSLNDKRYINVCMEMINYQPKTLEELLNL